VMGSSPLPADPGTEIVFISNAIYSCPSKKRGIFFY